jgi:hypothetical protein
MRLRHIGYGIFVSTAATIGTVLWYDRADHMIKLEDRLELRMGYSERCLATQLSRVVDPSMSTVVGYEPAIIGYETNTFFYADPANPTNQIETNYAIIGPRAVTGLNWSLPAEAYNPFAVRPPAYSSRIFDYDYTNKFIYGGWSNAVVSGFTGSYAARNGTYSNNTSINSYTRGFLFKKVGGGFFDYFTYDDHATIFSGTSGQELTRAMLPWFNELPAVSVSVTNQFPVVVMSNLNASAIVDHPLFTVEPYVGWPTLSIMDAWAMEMGTIDGGLLGEIYTGVLGTTSPVSEFAINHSLLWGSQEFTATNETITATSFIDSNYFGVASYAHPTNLLIDVPALMASIGGYSTNYYGYFDPWLFPDTKLTRTMLFLRYARAGFYPSRELFEMRYKAIQALKTTLGADLSWYRGEPVNYYVWQGTGATWAAAVANTALVESATADLAPMCLTMGRRDAADFYTFRAVRRSGVLRVGVINTNTESALAYYAFAGTALNPPDSILTTNLQARTFYDYGEGLTVSNYCLFDSDLTAAYRSNAVSSVAIGSADPLSVLCAEPVDVGASTVRGFYVEGQSAMIDWAFRHCTNSL